MCILTTQIHTQQRRTEHLSTPHKNFGAPFFGTSENCYVFIGRKLFVPHSFSLLDLMIPQRIFTQYRFLLLQLTFIHHCQSRDRVVAGSRTDRISFFPSLSLSLSQFDSKLLVTTLISGGRVFCHQCLRPTPAITNETSELSCLAQAKQPIRRAFLVSRYSSLWHWLCLVLLQCRLLNLCFCPATV